ncbi:MAG: divergent polysaccharide deacetylase family protein [Candidatus Omnitrophica bacterium]|nr:divergent polysaccharide deacetylase family protein [Candidatus Omnitrophota bacterium]
MKARNKKKAKNVLIALSILVLVLAAFYLGQRTQVTVKKKEPVKKAAKVRAIKKKSTPVSPAVKPSRGAKVAIVIDDFGYNTNNLAVFFDIKEPLTFSILPNLRYSREIAKSAREHGCESILHLPMASHRKDVAEEADTIKPGESKKEVLARLSKDIGSVPGISGVSNHMGSLATEDKELMTEIFEYLKKRNLYFFDSLTSEKSVCGDVAGSVNIRFAKRDMFLDNSNNVDKIEGELSELKKMALKRGRAIAICHDRKNTAIALAKAMPQMVKEGIEFVYLSDMVK